MKSLKITLLLAVLFASLTACVEQDLNEDDLLEDANTYINSPGTGGGAND
ncbi:hypothetical protein MHTCC0001_20600 [Flavobacteriaceae bacterium MHTCC 0001]